MMGPAAPKFRGYGQIGNGYGYSNSEKYRNLVLGIVIHCIHVDITSDTR